MRAALIIMMTMALLTLAAGPAAAHKVNVFAYPEAGKLMGQGYFSGGGEAKGCRVILHGPDGAKLAETKTNDKGDFALDLPKGKYPLTVELIASSGHRATYTLGAKELGEAPAGQKKAAPPAKAVAEKTKTTPKAVAMDQAALQAAVRQAVAKELGPVKAELARMNADRGVGIRDVVGGLGYILGLLGLGAYMHYRRLRG